ncbi:hypothetical protein [Nocardioides marmorisolisilvae]|nr:hypothetical protein [Nocardioides marmorisolisilvae]
MQNVTVFYRAEVDYRHEQVAREFRPTRSRRAVRKADRNPVGTRTDAA